MRYARGHLAWGVCQRSGKKLLYKDMVRDGYHPNMMVAPDWWEDRHPQERLARVDDPIALLRPTPDNPPPGEDTPAPPVTTLPFD